MSLVETHNTLEDPQTTLTDTLMDMGEVPPEPAQEPRKYHIKNQRPRGRAVLSALLLFSPVTVESHGKIYEAEIAHTIQVGAEKLYNSDGFSVVRDIVSIYTMFDPPSEPHPHLVVPKHLTK